MSETGYGDTKGENYGCGHLISFYKVECCWEEINLTSTSQMVSMRTSTVNAQSFSYTVRHQIDIHLKDVN